MKRRDFLNLIGASTAYSLLLSIKQRKKPVAAKESISKAEMFEQLRTIEDSLNGFDRSDLLTIFMSAECNRELSETMFRATRTIDTQLLFGIPVSVSKYLPFVDSKGKMVHIVVLKNTYMPAGNLSILKDTPLEQLTPWGKQWVAWNDI